MSGKGSRMQNLLLYRMRITVNDGRQLTGQLLAFDKHMNMVLGDCEEFRRVKSSKTGKKGGTGTTQEEKRTLGLVILRGEHVVSLSVEAPPPNDTVGRAGGIPSGPGMARAVGRGLPVSNMATMQAPAGLAGPVRGVGGGGPPQMFGRPPMGGAPFGQPPPGFRPPQ